MESILLKIRAKHFANAVYSDPGRCAISNALRDHSGEMNRINTGTQETYINGKVYQHHHYGWDDFMLDKTSAKSAKHPDVIVRFITLTPMH